MAKQLTSVSLRIDSVDEGTTKTIRCFYKVDDTADAALCKSGEYVHPSPDFTKTVDVLFTECVDGAKTAEGIA